MIIIILVALVGRLQMAVPCGLRPMRSEGSVRALEADCGSRGDDERRSADGFGSPGPLP